MSGVCLTTDNESDEVNEVGGLDAKDQHIHKLETQIEHLQSEMATVRATATTTVETTRQASEQLLALQDEGTAFVLTCLEDLKHDEVPTGSGGGGGVDSKSDDLKRPTAANGEPLSLFNLPTSQNSTVAERKRVLELLLSKLRATGAAAIAAADQIPTDDGSGGGGGGGEVEGDDEPLPVPAPQAAPITRAAPARSTGSATASVRAGGSVVVSAQGGTGFEI